MVTLRLKYLLYGCMEPLGVLRVLQDLQSFTSVLKIGALEIEKGFGVQYTTAVQGVYFLRDLV